MQYSQMLRIFLILATAWLFSCNSSQPAQYQTAPLDSKPALEKLASAYNSIAETIPVSAVNLRPAARKKFVVQVFNEAGFNYSATLQALSKVPASSVSQYHKDMQQLLFLPHYNIKFEEAKDIYTVEEVNAIETINRSFGVH
ncbi:MAG: hypothetical protein P8Y28_05370 [Gammaproteobacteria bacterium]